MLDIKFIREHKDLVKEAVTKKKSSVDIDALIALDDKRLELLKKVETLRAQQNTVSSQVAQTNDPALRESLIHDMKSVKDQMKQDEDVLKEIMQEWQGAMLKIPNIFSADTPIGSDDSENIVLRSWGEKPQFSFIPKDHSELGEALGILDTETAGKVAGSRFAYLKGDLVLLQFALVQLVFTLLTDEEFLKKIIAEKGLSLSAKPFVPILPPVFIRPLVQVKMARFMTPEEHYLFPNDDLMLVGSAEHTIGSMHMDQTFDESDLPIRYIGYSTAFRREAGTYGKDTKGILRQHQFDKLEMETFCLPEHSTQEQNLLVAIQEHLLQLLKLPYQVVSVCTGDMGFPDYRQIDIETWMPGQDTYRETHSADLTGGFQSRRLNTRIKRPDGKIEPVHMNDATAFAAGRLLIAIIENYQQPDGSIKIPEVLVPYMQGRTHIIKK
jgi:seryl-tRNA synthetase